MSFMRASISSEPETWLITENDDGETCTCLPDGDYDSDMDEEELSILAEENSLDYANVVEDYKEALKISRNNDFSIRTGFRGWLAAPGYLDRTPAVIADSVAEVARELLDLYYDSPLDEMDDDELEDAEWLSDLCDYPEQVEAIRAEIDRRGAPA